MSAVTTVSRPITFRLVRFGVLASGLALLLAARANAQGVRFERTGYRLTSLGERMAVSGRVVDARRRPIPSTRLRWRVSDSTIAAVSSSGVVVSRRPGFTKLWAVAGKDSASAIILVDQWAAKFEFSPGIVRFDAVGAKTQLKVQVRDAAGHVIAEQNRKPAACRSVSERIASLAASGELVAKSNGITYVRCTDRGIADSVRVEVRQRAVRAVIADKSSIATRYAAGDTFKLRLAAFDRDGDEIRDVQPTWASLAPNVLTVDPLTGFARSVAAGQVQVVAQVGDVTDTARIQIQTKEGMPVAVAGDTASGLTLEAPKTPTMQLQSLYLQVGDTSKVPAVVRDAAGATIANPSLSFRSADTSVVGIASGRSGTVVVARAEGKAYVIAQFGAMVDSVQVNVRQKGNATITDSAGATAVAFVRPRFNTDSARRAYQERHDSAAAAIKRASIVDEVTGRYIVVSAVAAQAAHSSTPSRNFTESRSGLLYGGHAEAAPISWLRLSGDFRTGSLASLDKPIGEDMKVTEAEANVTFSPAEWLGFGAGYVIRGESTPIATQRWSFPRVGVTTRFTFVGGFLTTVTGISLLPGASYTGYADSTGTNLVAPNPLSLAGEAGLQIRSGVFTAALSYYVEKFTFPEVAGVVRKDQFSTIRLRVGLQKGR